MASVMSRAFTHGWPPFSRILRRIGHDYTHGVFRVKTARPLARAYRVSCPQGGPWHHNRCHLGIARRRQPCSSGVLLVGDSGVPPLRSEPAASRPLRSIAFASCRLRVRRDSASTSASTSCGRSASGAGRVAGRYALASTLLASIASLHPSRSGTLHVAARSRAPPRSSCSAMSSPRSTTSATAADLQTLADEGLLHASIAVPRPSSSSRRRRATGLSATSSPAAAPARRGSPSESAARRAVDAVDPWAAWLGGVDDLARTRAAACGQRGYRSHRRRRGLSRFASSSTEAKREVDALRLEALGVVARYTDALCGSERLLASGRARRERSAGRPRIPGVVLVGHGQPEDALAPHRSFDEQETVFLSRVRMLLVERGSPRPRAHRMGRVASPDVTCEVRHLAALGCERIIVVPARTSRSTPSSTRARPAARRCDQARVDDAVVGHRAPGVADDPRWS